MAADEENDLLEMESCLEAALYSVSIHANSVWWHGCRESYRTANLSLWLEVLRSKIPEPQLDERLAEGCTTCYTKLASNGLTHQEMELPEDLSIDPVEWLRGHSWPTAIARNFPALSLAISGNRDSLYHYSSVLEQMYEKNQPYKLETPEEQQLYKKTINDNIRKIWATPRPPEPCPSRGCRKPDIIALNANVPEFYPSVLLPSLQCPPPYPNVADQSYHMELFPYHEQNVMNEVEASQWQMSPVQQNSNVQSQMPVYSTQEALNDWRNRQNVALNSLILCQRAQQQVQQTRQRLAAAQVVVQRSAQQGFQPMFIGQNVQPLLISDFPELPKTRGSNTGPHIKCPCFPEQLNIPDRQPENLSEMRAWLQSVYPQRAAEFSSIAAAASHFEAITRRVVGLPPQEIPQQQQMEMHEIIQPPSGCQEGRRLYRDVLASKGKENENNMEGKYEELEREAMEQYLSSDGQDMMEDDEVSPEMEDTFRDLERQAVEQYEDPEEPILVMSTSRTQSSSAGYPEVASSASPTASDGALATSAVDSPLENGNLQHKDDTDSCSHLETQTFTDKECKHSAEDTDRKDTGKGNARKSPPRSKKDQKTKSRLLRSRRRRTPVARNCLELELKNLASALKIRALNYLKEVDLRPLNDERTRVSVRELLYQGRKASVREMVKISDIRDTDTFRLYVKEIQGLARDHLQIIYKRTRGEVMDMTSRGPLYIVQPLTSEKRKVRYLIKKCVELLEKAELMKKLPKKPLESSKKEVVDTLNMIHRTMNVVFALRDMTREAFEDVEYLRNSRLFIIEFLLGKTYLEDKSEYIRRRVEVEKRSLLLYLICPRREGFLMDRVWENLLQGTALYLDPLFTSINNTLILKRQKLAGILNEFDPRCDLQSDWLSAGVKRVRYTNTCLIERPKKRELWSEISWIRKLLIGKHSYNIDIIYDRPVSEVVLPAGFLPEPGKATVNISKKRKTDAKSDIEITGKSRHFGDRGYSTWPKTCRTPSFFRLLKSPVKERKKPAKADGSCALM